MSDEPVIEAKTYPPGYPQKGMSLCIASDMQHVLLVAMQVDGPGAEPKTLGRPTDVTQGFWASFLNICPPGQKTPVYGNGKHVMTVTVEMADQAAVPEEDLAAVPAFVAPERKPLDLSKL